VKRRPQYQIAHTKLTYAESIASQVSDRQRFVAYCVSRCRSELTLTSNATP
jgi:hypothetical protein